MKLKFYKNILLIALFVLIGMSINFLLDSYGVYGHSLDKQVLEPNKNYIKTKYILENSDKYDSFILGSSKVGQFSAESLKNGKYYNMTYSQGLPAEWLDTLKVFLKNKIIVKNIIVGIDSFSFTVNPETHYNQPMRIPYSQLNKKKKFETYLLTNPLNSYNYTTLKERFINKKSYNFFYSEKNKDTKPDDEIEKNQESHIKNKKFNSPIAFNQVNRSEKTILELQEIKEICDLNNIKVYFIINPIHQLTYENSNIEGLNSLKHELSLFTDYWDFSEQGKIAKNNFYWYETSHFRTNIADLILKTIFQEQFDKEIDLEYEKEIFGKYIKK